MRAPRALPALLLVAACAAAPAPTRPPVAITPAFLPATEPMDTLILPTRCKGPVIPIGELAVNGFPYRDTLTVLTIDCNGAFRRFIERVRMYQGPPGKLGGEGNGR